MFKPSLLPFMLGGGRGSSSNKMMQGKRRGVEKQLFLLFRS